MYVQVEPEFFWKKFDNLEPKFEIWIIIFLLNLQLFDFTENNQTKRRSNGLLYLFHRNKAFLPFMIVNSSILRFYIEIFRFKDVNMFFIIWIYLYKVFQFDLFFRNHSVKVPYFIRYTKFQVIVAVKIISTI